MAWGFYNQFLLSASLFWFFIRRSKKVDLKQNLVYIILGRPNFGDQGEHSSELLASLSLLLGSTKQMNFPINPPVRTRLHTSVQVHTREIIASCDKVLVSHARLTSAVSPLRWRRHSASVTLTPWCPTVSLHPLPFPLGSSSSPWRHPRSGGGEEDTKTGPTEEIRTSNPQMSLLTDAYPGLSKTECQRRRVCSLTKLCSFAICFAKHHCVFL